MNNYSTIIIIRNYKRNFKKKKQQNENKIIK